MKETILIPTDFTSGSLNTLKVFFEKYARKEVKYNVLFVSGYHLSDSITDLLFMSKSKVVNSIINQDYIEAINILKNKFEDNFHSVQLDIFTGSSQSAFNAYLEVNQVAEVYLGSSFTFRSKRNKRCFDLSRYAINSQIGAVVIQQSYTTQTSFMMQEIHEPALEAIPVIQS